MANKRLPRPPAEVARETRVDTLPQGMRHRVEALLRDMQARGHRAIIGESWRTNRRQAHLYGFGRRYDDGRGRVTNAPTAADSWHGYGLAVDIWDAANARAPWTPVAPTVFYADLQALCRTHGLRWGADWDNDGKTADERFMDRPHVQLLSVPVKPSADDRADFAAGRIAAVWARYRITPQGGVVPHAA